MASASALLGIGSPLADLLVPPPNPLLRSPGLDLLEEIAQTVRATHLQDRLTDWPFENFWLEPDEPRHSKLIRYFIDPQEKSHGCGEDLLKELLAVILPEAQLPATNCVVTAETRHADFGQIDLLIVHQEGKPEDYAVILENKIHGAEHQEEQLSRYVARILQNQKSRNGQGIAPERIYACYLPLVGGPHPDPKQRAKIKEDQAKVASLGARWVDLSFKEHILPWITRVLQSDQEAPLIRLPQGLVDNLTHYRNLLQYLLKVQSSNTMNAQLLKKLAQATERGQEIGLSQIQELKKALADLELCATSAILGELLLELQRRFIDLGAFICAESKPDTPIAPASRFDSCFLKSVNVCVPAGNAVKVCFGGNIAKSILWYGYMKTGKNADLHAAVESQVAQEMKAHFGSIEDNEIWYGWEQWKENFSETYAADKVDEVEGHLRNFHASLCSRLESQATPSE